MLNAATARLILACHSQTGWNLHGDPQKRTVVAVSIPKKTIGQLLPL